MTAQPPGNAGRLTSQHQRSRNAGIRDSSQYLGLTHLPNQNETVRNQYREFVAISLERRIHVYRRL